MNDVKLSRQRKTGAVVLSLFLLTSLFLNACGGDAQQQQRQASKDRLALEQLISHAQTIGVPPTLLQPIQDQTAKLNKTQAPIALFSSQPAQDYYTNLSQRYTVLAMQVRGIETQATQQAGFQANSDIQTFQSLLVQRQGQGFFGVQAFADQLTQDQNMLDKAQYPKNFSEVSANAQNSVQALRLMGPAYERLKSFRETIKQLKASNLDVAALELQEQGDTQRFQKANKAEDFQQLIEHLNTQLQATVTLSTQAIPYVGEAKLKGLRDSIAEMKLYEMNTTTYQKRLDADKAALDKARTIGDFLKISAQIDNDVASARTPLLIGKAKHLLKQYHQEVESWGASHQYYNKYNNTSYKLDYEYDQEHGFGSDLDGLVQYAQSTDDYQAAIDQITNMQVHLRAMQSDYSDKTTYNQPHASDQQLMNHYKLNSGTVIVVSFIGQTLRYYQDGKLSKAFYVTTGQYLKPTPPGLWHIFVRKSPTKFKSWEPKGSAFWYPDTDINFAMEYRDNGYYLHDSTWRLDYGPGTNFPHYDSGGDEDFAGNGSHGCINMTNDLAGWLYQNTTYGTPVIVY